MRLWQTGGLLLGAFQTILAVRVLRRMMQPAGPPITAPSTMSTNASVSVVVPVLNEVARLGPCLDGLMSQDHTVAEIPVVDGGSTDGTQALVDAAGRRDSRVRLVDASPVPSDWNGKAWGLHVGAAQSRPDTRWLLTVDADVRPRAGLVAALVARAEADGVAAASVATRQEVAGVALGMLHPACLTTLVYRLGTPGRVARRPADVQANGQCQVFERAALERVGGFGSVRASRCEDVTIARAMVADGGQAGFYEASSGGNAEGHGAGLVSVRMYDHWRDAWEGWTRSLPLRDRFTRWSSLLGLGEVTLVQALPLPLVVWLLSRSPWRADHRGSQWLLALNVLLLLVRVGVLAGTRRAYSAPSGAYWLSPLVDVPVAVQLWISTLKRRHTWRGRPLVTGVHN